MGCIRLLYKAVRLWRRRKAAVLRNDIHPKRILVDVSVIAQGDAGTGIQRVVRALYLQLKSSLPLEVNLCPVVATRRRGYRMIEGDFLNELHGAPIFEADLVRPQADDVFLGLDLATHLLPRHAQQIRGWRRCGVKIFLVVYDLLPVKEPNWFTPKAVRRFKRWLSFLAVYADGAICISGHVRDMLILWLDDYLPGSSTDITLSTIKLGANIKETLLSGGVGNESFRVDSQFEMMRTVLMVGTIEPRKSHADALEAFEHIWQTDNGADVALAIVGRPGWKTSSIQSKLRKHEEMGRRLFWFDDASDEQLDWLYQRCSGILVASLDEGFGLPLIEAARYDLPILARDIAVFREVAPPWTTYFSGREPAVLACAIMSWLKDTKRVDAASFAIPTWEDARDDLFAALNLDTSHACNNVMRSAQGSRSMELRRQEEVN